MPVQRISGPDDPRVQAYQAVADPVLLRRHGLFVAEGRLVVDRLLAARRYEVQSLLLSEAAFHALEPSLAALPGHLPVYLSDPADLRRIAGYDVHRGCLALAVRPAPPRLEDLLAGARLLVVLEGVTNADNVGSVFRNAAAFGVDAVLLDHASCDPWYRKAIRTSMAATLRMPFARLAHDAAGWPGALDVLRSRGITLIALTPSASARDLHDVGPPRLPLALMLGSEGSGLSAAAEAVADDRVRIPIRADVDSLNLAVAAGIALHAIATAAGATSNRQHED
jgi:tRNA G18 (ribose-2'-O)-methylase SpoU